MDYKKKYLKYKLKYLQAKQNFKGGDPDDPNQIIITVETIDTRPKELTVLETDKVNDAIAAAFAFEIRGRGFELFLGDGQVSGDDTFKNNGIQDGARLNMRLKATVEEVMTDIIELNPHLTPEELMVGVSVDPEDASRVLGNIDWSSKRIVALPESIGDITVDGDLNLGFNNLNSLPASFGSLTVGENLYLHRNNLVSLPESIIDLTVGDSLYLNFNQLATLPENFNSLIMGGMVYLTGNPVTKKRHKP